MEFTVKVRNYFEETSIWILLLFPPYRDGSCCCYSSSSRAMIYLPDKINSVAAVDMRRQSNMTDRCLDSTVAETVAKFQNDRKTVNTYRAPWTSLIYCNTSCCLMRYWIGSLLHWNERQHHEKVLFRMYNIDTSTMLCISEVILWYVTTTMGLFPDT